MMNEAKYFLAGLPQSSAVHTGNPAVELERQRLERRALDALRKWAVMNPIERVMSFAIEQAASDLIAFEGRHQIDQEAA